MKPENESGSPTKSFQLAQQRHVLETLNGNNIRVEEQVTNNRHADLSKIKASFKFIFLLSFDMKVNKMVEAFTELLSFEDIDPDNEDDLQLWTSAWPEYVEYLRHLEQQFYVDPMYMNNQPEINEGMRAILVNWVVQVHLRLSLFEKTLYLTVSIIDRYLGVGIG